MSKLTTQGCAYLTPVSKTRLTSYLRSVRALVTQDPKEISFFYSLRDYYVENDHARLWMLMDHVCDCVPAKIAEAFMAETFQLMGVENWDLKTVEVPNDRIKRALQRQVSKSS